MKLVVSSYYMIIRRQLSVTKHDIEKGMGVYSKMLEEIKTGALAAPIVQRLSYTYVFTDCTIKSFKNNNS